MRDTPRAHALRALAEPSRFKHIKSTERGLVFDVIGESADRFDPTPYRVMRYEEAEDIHESCTCPNGKVHPVRPRCWHIEVARIVMRVSHGW